MEGTHLGEWLDMKPTGKKLRITGVNIDRLVDGKIVKHGGTRRKSEAISSRMMVHIEAVRNTVHCWYLFYVEKFI